MTDIMRQEFEVWVIKQNVCVKYGAKLIQCRDGSYKDYRINDRWNSWKSSRAAQCVELPKRDEYSEIPYGTIEIFEVQQSLTDAGVRYK